MKKIIPIVLICIMLLGMFACTGGSSDKQSTTAIEKQAETKTADNEAAEAVATEQNETEKVETEEKVTETVAKETEPDMTLGQRNAVNQAQSYLAFSAFSRDGLLEQLTSEYGSKYPEDDAEFAISYLEENDMVDWNEQARKNAQSYLDFSAFSRAGLIDQLSSEYGARFTEEQAAQAVDYLEENNLVDWNEQAVRQAESYLEFSSFSRDELIDQLSSEYGSQFTREQAEYAVEQVGY